jgi:branched-chain amino acid aminotransferase
MEAHTFLTNAFFEGKIQLFVDCKLSIATHALHYGTGAFGGIRGNYRDGKVYIFRIEDHAKRLSNSAKYFNYEISPELIQSRIIDMVKSNKDNITKDFYIRPLVYVSDSNVSPKIHGLKKDFLVYGLELGNWFSDGGITCRFSSFVRQEDRSAPLRAKITGTYIMSSMAKSEAQESGYDEAIIFNSQGKVCEASAMNIFIVRDGVIYTPGVDQDILEGITRKSIIELARFFGYTVVERAIDRTELIIADEVFITGSAGKVTSVRKIENYNLPQSKPITDILTKEYGLIVTGQNPKFQDWITVV